MAIDLNRGVSKRVHQATGIQVVMYKDAPGVYYDTVGNPVSAELASQAGFQVSEEILQKQKNDKMAKAMKEIESEYEGNSDGDIIYEEGDLKVQCVGKDLYDVIRIELNEAVNDKPLNEKTALTLAETLLKTVEESSNGKTKA